VLTQYQEASGDPRVIPVMEKYFSYELKTLPQRPLRDWGKYRWQDNVYSVLWLYNRTGNRRLLDLARMLHEQGYDWEKQFADFQYRTKQTRDTLHLIANRPIPEAAMQTHGVNNAMAIKTAPLWWLLTGSASDRQALQHQLAALDTYHGLPNGMFSADEHFAGPDPSQGVEVCAVVEAMFSLEQAFGILGDPRLADRLERVAYNALPATLSNDMWSHQYDQQPNQIACTRAHRQWSTNDEDSNLFGLEPNFGCCTANFHQGWPKLVESLWLQTSGGTLVSAVYSPNVMHTKIKGASITIEEETEYPFRGTVHFKVHASHPVAFPLLLRIPGWAQTTQVRLNNKSLNISAADCSVQTTEAKTDEQSCDFQKSFIPIDRIWNDDDQVFVTFAVPARVSRWHDNAAVFERGPLVFSLPLKGKWSKLKQYAQNSADWQITPTSAWNFAVKVGECDAIPAEHGVSAVPFDAAAPPVTLAVQARRYPAWTESENSAGPLPNSPVESREPLQELTLVPYGAAKLRITEFPTLVEKSQCSERTF